MEGQTLHELLKNGPLQLNQVLLYATQITEALDAAHAKGIVHRDIKPGNIMVDQRGNIKVLDFGLAAVTGTVAQRLENQSSTILTQPGIVMGTVQYMSPEQALGAETDSRADIFSLGSTLYEMLTGTVPFSGKTPVSIIDQILHTEPQGISRVMPDTPPELDRIIHKCLEKDLGRRYQSAKELLTNLKTIRNASFSPYGADLETRSAPGTQKRGSALSFLPVVRKVPATAYWLVIGTSLLTYALSPFLHVGNSRVSAVQSLAVLPLTTPPGSRISITSAMASPKRLSTVCLNYPS